MTDTRTYDVYAEATYFTQQLVTARQQLAEAMAMCAELSAELEDAQHLRDGWKAEAMEARKERAELVEEAHALKDMQGANVRFIVDALHKWQAEMDALRAERDAANRRADDAVEAYSVAVVKVSGAGWWC